MAASSQAKKVRYEGHHSNLMHGRYYTIKKLSEITGLSDTAIRYRLNGSNICTDDELVKSHCGKTLRKKKEQVSTTLSQKWLTRKLIRGNYNGY
jgi:hypothetical protein